MAKRAQQESGEGRVTAKSRPLMNLTARTPSFVSSSASSNPWRTSHGYQDPERSVLGDRTGQLVETSRSDYIMVYPGLLKSGKVELRRTIDQGNLRKLLGIWYNKVAPYREEPLLDGNAHSVRYGEMIHDGSGKLEKVNSQEGADSETFVMGSDAAEFVNLK